MQRNPVIVFFYGDIRSKKYILVFRVHVGIPCHGQQKELSYFNGEIFRRQFWWSRSARRISNEAWLVESWI